MLVLAVLLVLVVVVVLVEFEEGLLLLFPPLNAEIAIFANP